MVTIHGDGKLADGLSAKVIGYDKAANLYVVKDANAAIWGLKTERLQPV